MMIPVARVRRDVRFWRWTASSFHDSVPHGRLSFEAVDELSSTVCLMGVVKGSGDPKHLIKVPDAFLHDSA